MFILELAAMKKFPLLTEDTAKERVNNIIKMERRKYSAKKQLTLKV